MSIFYVSPTAIGLKNGSSWENSASLDKLPSLLATAEPGSTIMLLADAGSYTIGRSISLTAGGEEGEPVTIKGVDRYGNDMNARFVGDRAEVYSPSAVQGSEVFRILTGADHLTFQNMDFQNVSNVFRLAGNNTDLTIENMTATNVSRFIDNFATGSAVSATVSDLVVRDIQVDGFAKGTIRLQYDTHDVLIERVDGDSRHIDGANFAIGIALDGTVHDVLIRDTQMGNITDTTNRYRNGDGFATEEDVYNITFQNTLAYNNTDSGYDIKSLNTTLIDTVSEGSTRNYRFWAKDTVVENLTAINPVHRGGSSTASNIWLNTDAHVTIDGGTIIDDDGKEIMIDLNYPGAVLDIVNVVSNLSDGIIKMSPTSVLNGAVGLIVGAIDTIYTELDTYTLGGTVDNLVYVGMGNFAGTGNALDNQITGGEGDDLLDGKAGADTLTGGLGDDTYVVDRAGDSVIELANGGSDTIRTGLAGFTLGGNVENILYTGAGAFTGTGNALANQMTGAAGNDSLNGGGGADVLDGGLGNDALVGGSHFDLLYGGRGHDLLIGDYTAGVNQGASNDKIWGEAGDDRIYGDGLTMSGGIMGRDQISGGAGNDVIFGDAGGLTGGVAGADWLSGDEGDDWIYGDAGTSIGASGGADRLAGGAGNDHLFGGGGNDVFDYKERGSGHDVIHDFGQVAGDMDKIELSGRGLRFANPEITYEHGNATVTLSPTETITVLNVSYLSSADFVF